MVLIREGEFMMGSPDSDKDADEKPQHRVRITKPFFLGKYLVTQEQWEAVMGNNPSRFKGPKNPVEQVSWDECQEFIKKLNKRSRPPHPGPLPEGAGDFRLPTEAQWEYALRAGSTTRIALGTTRVNLASTRGTRTTRAARRTPLARKSRTPGGCTTCTGTYGSGARIGMIAITMQSRRRTIRWVLPGARSA